jgi:hypothetical protein
MGSVSIAHWLVLAVVTLASTGIFVVPCWIIFKRAGWSPALSLLLLVPGAALVLLWVFALVRWPTLDQTSQA